MPHASRARALSLAVVPANARPEPAQTESQDYTATLVEHAQLPAQSFMAPPADAPAMFNLSGRFTAKDGQRVERPYGIHDEETGLSGPFPGQPLQGFSGIRSLGDDRFLVLTDNGFGTKANSADALLMVSIVQIDWDQGRVMPERAIFLSDPDRMVPFPIVNEATGRRSLTGADFDIEAIQPVGALYWIGDEFGPWLIEVDAGGEVQQVVATDPGGRLHRSPDNAFLSAPDRGNPAAPEQIAMRSGGHEGMALSEDGRTLYPLLEKPVWDAEAGAPETVGGSAVLRLFAFDTGTGEWSDTVRYYPLEDAAHAIGDFNIIGGTRALIIERDGGQGGGWSERPARFKRIYLVDLERIDDNGVLDRIAHIDLMKIADPDTVARRGTEGGIFTFPFVTIENVDRVDATTIVAANDNNFPFSIGREPGRADDSEFILLEVADFLNAG